MRTMVRWWASFHPQENKAVAGVGCFLAMQRVITAQSSWWEQYVCFLACLSISMFVFFFG